MRVTFINNGTRDKPRTPPYYGVFLRSACRENSPSWCWRGMFPTEKTLSPFCRKFGDDISGIRRPPPRRFLSPWDTAQVRNTLRDGSVAVSPVQYLMPPCNEGFCFPSGQNYIYIYKCIRSTYVKIDYFYRNNKIY